MAICIMTRLQLANSSLFNFRQCSILSPISISTRLHSHERDHFFSHTFVLSYLIIPQSTLRNNSNYIKFPIQPEAL